jgi:hypothetical protein
LLNRPGVRTVVADKKGDERARVDDPHSVTGRSSPGASDWWRDLLIRRGCAPGIA